MYKTSKKSTAGLRVGCFEGSARTSTSHANVLVENLDSYLIPQRQSHYEFIRNRPQRSGAQ